MERRQRVRAIFETYRDAKRAVDALIEQSFSPRRIDIRAEIEDQWRRLPVSFQRRDAEGATFGALAGTLVVATAIAANAAGYMALGHGTEPVFAAGWQAPALSLAAGAFLGGLAGVLWGLGRSELIVPRPEPGQTDRYVIEVEGPKSQAAREILLREGALSVAS